MKLKRFCVHASCLFVCVLFVCVFACVCVCVRARAYVHAEYVNLAHLHSLHAHVNQVIKLQVDFDVENTTCNSTIDDICVDYLMTAMK